jgi:aspartate/tyrosine/aromatic aminotransferase
MFIELGVPHVISFNFPKDIEQKHDVQQQYVIQEWLLDFSIGFYKNIVKCLPVNETIKKAEEYILEKRKNSKN